MQQPAIKQAGKYDNNGCGLEWFGADIHFLFFTQQGCSNSAHFERSLLSKQMLTHRLKSCPFEVRSTRRITLIKQLVQLAF